MSLSRLTLFIVTVWFSLLPVNQVIAASLTSQNYQEYWGEWLGQGNRFVQPREAQLNLEQPSLEFKKFNPSLPSQLGGSSSVIAQKFPNVPVMPDFPTM
ncbi:MAG TPA: hypothetical protein DD379_01765, partial [Cyanobacteria bacterium UBA11162]|nr:hypothetical protein [Cyanobacteria bacterium UBA11162]